MLHILFEDESRADLLPLTFTRPVFDLRIGILTLREKWNSVLHTTTGALAESYLMPLEKPFTASGELLLWNGKFFPANAWVHHAQASLPAGSFYHLPSGELLALRLSAGQFGKLTAPLTASQAESAGLRPLTWTEEAPFAIRRPSDIFQQNGRAIRDDFERITAGRVSKGIPVSSLCTVFGEENIFVEEGAKLRAAILNAEEGPIYIGRNANIGEGVMIHGTHAICENASLSMGAKLRGESTIGPGCKAGGEVSNSVLLANSNKSHDGFLGNSVLGEWCNLGADSNTSNLKNNYTEVKLWNYPRGRFDRTGTIFCGLVMGDHSKCGINTMFNTGTVAGVSANIFGDGYPRNFIPDFSWGGSAGLSTYAFDKAMEVVRVVMKRRNLEPTLEQVAVLRHVFDETARFRTWEKQEGIREA